MNILWDIDGTLIANDRLHTNLYMDAVRDIFGITGEIAEFEHDGKTDRQIILEYIASTGNDQSRENEVEAWLELRSPNFYLDPSSARKALGGAENAVQVAAEKGHTNLLMTGNSRLRACAKLRGAGFDVSAFNWDMSAFGSDFATRPGLARYLASTISGGVVVGDTPGDGHAAKSGHFSFIGVTTGVYSREDLIMFQPVVVLSSFELELDLFVDALDQLDLN